MTDSNTILAVLTYKQTTKSLGRLADRRRVHVEDVTRPRGPGTQGHPNLTVFVCYVADMDDAALASLKQVASSIQMYLLVSEQGCVEAIAERVARLNIRSPERLHIASSGEGETTDSMWRRFLSVLSAGQHDHRILDAWWENQDFVVMSQRFERLRLSLDQLRMLRFLTEKTRGELEHFEIAEDGSYVRWPEFDVDLDWNGFARLSGQENASRQAESRAFRSDYGAAIRRLRELHGLRQRDMKEIDERHVRRIEKGESSATASALKKLARSHEMSVRDYLDELARLVEAS